jgi:hypothetical protein
VLLRTQSMCLGVFGVSLARAPCGRSVSPALALLPACFIARVSGKHPVLQAALRVAC